MFHMERASLLEVSQTILFNSHLYMMNIEKRGEEELSLIEK